MRLPFKMRHFVRQLTCYTVITGRSMKRTGSKMTILEPDIRNRVIQGCAAFYGPASGA
jgi:hypothetical protein